MLQPQGPIGGERDVRGCLSSAGYSWCPSLQRCIRPWQDECPGTQCPPPHASQNCRNCTGVELNGKCYEKCIQTKEGVFPINEQTTSWLSQGEWCGATASCPAGKVRIELAVNSVSPCIDQAYLCEEMAGKSPERFVDLCAKALVQERGATEDEAQRHCWMSYASIARQTYVHCNPQKQAGNAV